MERGSLDPRPNPRGRVWGITLLGSDLLECHGLSNSATNFLFQIFNAIGQALLQFSKFLCSTVYSLPVIGVTWTLVGWSDVRSLISTDSSIPALKTLPGKVFPQTLPRGLGLGSRLGERGVEENHLPWWCCLPSLSRASLVRGPGRWHCSHAVRVSAHKSCAPCSIPVCRGGRSHVIGSKWQSRTTVIHTIRTLAKLDKLTYGWPLAVDTLTVLKKWMRERVERAREDLGLHRLPVIYVNS